MPAACVGRFVLATCFGESTVMEGSGLAESVCDAAGPHSKTVDKTATLEGATRLGKNLMTCPPKSGTEMPSRQAHGTIHREVGYPGLKTTRHRHGNHESADCSRRCDVRFWAKAEPGVRSRDFRKRPNQDGPRLLRRKSTFEPYFYGRNFLM
ncbi:hypothetical protein [Bradyrhizobium sp. USDA 3364]